MEPIILPYKGKEPKVARDVFVAPGSSIVGEVEISCYTNIQDDCTVYVMDDSLTEINEQVK